MELGLQGRTALVCASTSGLGRATARALAEEGVTVVVTGRSSDRAREVAAEMPNAVGIGCDLVADGGAEQLLTAARKAVGDIDILVLNGPGPAPGPARDTDTAGIEQAIETLVKPQQLLVRSVLPAMLEKGWGRILSISSTSVEAPMPNLSLSNLGRAALAGYLKTLATEVASQGVTINSLLPGRIATPRARQIDEAAAQRTGRTLREVETASRAAIPAGRYGEPGEFGAAAAFLCSAPAAYITGTALRCDGGLVPTL
ncbi:3-oxoacyl-[acyl-carrier protein] reductase [Saccharopolyspora antimicrobica]|uniref:3-oxoacyl-[acyl-carrier protein] reductase n=1 Tax=Saccharopolyspora antimicrobica TaxID=455193 RepID=A0A1I5C0Z5_9PSEU|nr:3-oxoacyl-[acyl-carrier protein] reductase [Saccharopolyspora antimicrobica]SFN80669.1 3-oxoacyl-[acyl-carrier protein] reductase [Saccharopolyspora antimicrobica]